MLRWRDESLEYANFGGVDTGNDSLEFSLTEESFSIDLSVGVRCEVLPRRRHGSEERLCGAFSFGIYIRVRINTVGTRERGGRLILSGALTVKPFFTSVARDPKHALLICGGHGEAKFAHVAHYPDEVSAAFDDIVEAHVHGAEHVVSRGGRGDHMQAKRIALGRRGIDRQS